MEEIKTSEINPEPAVETIKVEASSTHSQIGYDPDLDIDLLAAIDESGNATIDERVSELALEIMDPIVELMRYVVEDSASIKDATLQSLGQAFTNPGLDGLAAVVNDAWGRKQQMWEEWKAEKELVIDEFDPEDKPRWVKHRAEFEQQMDRQV